MSHYHFPEGHPWHGRPCGFRTVRECDANWTTFLHGHLGIPCKREIEMSKTKRGQPNKIKTCVLIETPAGRSFAGELAYQRSKLELNVQAREAEAGVTEDVT